MYNLELTAEQLEQRRKDWETYKDTLTKAPTGDVKKEFCVGCFQKSDWDFIHVELMKDGSLEDNIPTGKCDCINDCLQSDVRGTYLLTETEAAELRKNPKVDYVNINIDAYPGTYAPFPDDLVEVTNRYSSNVKNQMQMTATSGGLIENFNSDKLNRAGSNVYRSTAKKNPWVTLGNPTTVVQSKLPQYGTGVDVDVIVCDQDMWFGHIEFQNPSGVTNVRTYDGTQPDGIGGSSSTAGPTNYVGGNVLKSGYSSSATTGNCDVLDLVLDAPYYIDPAWFEADAPNRLTLRWDGTTVPVESVARSWWSNSTQRSSQFANAGTISSSALSSYTRARCNGSNTAYHTGFGFHGTPCASQAYGRQYGWAYNANKWFLNLYGSGSVLWEAGADLQKIFHQNKPNRSSDNTKNPTVSSNSWGRRFGVNSEIDVIAGTKVLESPGYYFYRPNTTDGTTNGVQHTSWSVSGNTDGSNGTAPRFMTNRYVGGSQIQCEPQSGVTKTAFEEMTAAGVFFICAAGNHNQKCVTSTHPDYNNYVASGISSSLSDTEFFYEYDSLTYNQTINRPGFPQAFDKAISVGALDDTLLNGKEKKVNYSSTGDSVKFYITADQSLAAQDDNGLFFIGTRYPRYDSFYDYNSATSQYSFDCLFGGTSSATPIAAGLIATKLETNRTWTYSDLINWTTSTVGTQNTSDFHYGTDSASVNDLGWTDKNSIQGGQGIVLWDAVVTDSSDPTLLSSVPGNGATGVALDTNLVLNFSEPVIVHTGAIAFKDASDDSALEIIDVTSNQVTGSGTDQITINPLNNLTLNTIVYVQITDGSFKDAAGNSYIGISDKTSLRFTTTTDITNPTLVSTSPVTGATGVAVGANILLNFSEIVFAQNGNITIYNASDDSTLKTIDVSGVQVSGSGTSQITVNPSNDLPDNTTVYVQIAATCFDDAEGNSYAGITDKTTLRFTTASSGGTPTASRLSFHGTGLTLSGNFTIS